MIENICTFTPHHSAYHTLHTINYVYETDKQEKKPPKEQAMFKVHYICTGSGVLHLKNEDIPLSKGDVFFTFPDMPFSIESKKDFTYMYISFLGTRADMILDKLKISKYNFFFPECEELQPVWQKALTANLEISDLIIESILLYTFYHIGDRALPNKTVPEKRINVSYHMKKLIDEDFANPNLSLESIGQKLSYSPKYLSSVFKKTYNISATEYLKTVRIQHACALLKQGYESINDVSQKCGYRDAHYFCKIFKTMLGESPTKFVKRR